MRQIAYYHIVDIATFKKKLLRWSANFQQSISLVGSTESNHGLHLKYDMLVAVEALTELSVSENGFDSLKSYHDSLKDWIFGYLSYDLKNETEVLSSKNFDGLGFPQLYFFQPKWVFKIIGNDITIYFPESVERKEMQWLFKEINLTSTEVLSSNTIQVEKRTSKDEYRQAFQKLQHHISRGDIYEINYCQEFFAEQVELNPIAVFENLFSITQSPFSAYFQLNEHHLMCASPERFIKKEHHKIISQPIKGTRARGATKQIDDKLKKELLECRKEQSENVMIVDLVRNDLSKTAQPSSVRVEELFGVYSFLQVHQMISTVSSSLKDDIHWVDAIKSAFPMGSMTGAPKIMAMKLIEQHEAFKRSLYSGSVGYVTPHADFDFNVVIRSILYNSDKKYVSYSVGSAITSKATFENEYQECELKGKAMLEVLNA
ncbi:MAG: anthranilate synthase component I family protein [Flavobacteriales bacterium]